MSTDRYRSVKARGILMLGGCCATCGSTEELEFDHIDPKTKAFTITSDVNRTWASVEAELRKCQLLCAPCHRTKTLEQRPVKADELHGTLSSYRYCKCDLCRKAKSKATKDYREKNGRKPESREKRSEYNRTYNEKSWLEPIKVHGTIRASRRCCCDLCNQAKINKAAYMKEFMQAKRAKVKQS